MGPPRTAAARLRRVQSGRIRRWIATVGLRAKTLLRSSEAAETVLREVLEFFGEADAIAISASRGEALIRANWDRYCGRQEPGEQELMANVAILADLFALDDAERDIFALFAAIPTNPALQQVLERIDVRSRHQAARALALVLGHSVERIRAALSAESALARYYILNVTGGAFDFSQFGLLNEDLERVLSSGRPEKSELLSAFFAEAPPAGLSRDDFAHLEPRLTTLIAYLRGAAATAERGVNVLFYGVAGTGKTELARLIAEELEWRAYEVKTTNRDGTASSGDERMASFFIAQRFLENAKSRLVIFDEIEDLQGHAGYGQARLGKLFMNRLLERNAVGTIWIANDIDALDFAVRRRFDFSISFGPLPGVARRRVLERHLEGLDIDAETATQLLRREMLLPAQVGTGRKVARLVGTGKNQDVALLETIDASMRLLNQPVPRHDERLEFDASLCNADVDLETAICGLKELGGRGVVALYGPPGAGKSAFAGYLAEQLDRRAVRISASDLLSAFLGENEQRVARLFEAVDVASEVIVLEEADELLAARDATRQSWEVRLSNEMLMRMESFGGLVVLTTNALERLDAAALRRCHLKVRLDYMRAEQRAAMWCKRIGQPITVQISKRLRELDRLTAGDFVAVCAQGRIVGSKWHADDWITALEKEVALRPPISRPVGFVS